MRHVGIPRSGSSWASHMARLGMLKRMKGIGSMPSLAAWSAYLGIGHPASARHVGMLKRLRRVSA